MALSKPDMKILIVDDFPTMRRIVKTLLKQSGFVNFVEADDGEKAFAELEKHGDFEFIVSDWNMPRMSGIELLQKVRLSPKFCHLPFLLITAEAEKENLTEAIKSGVSSYLIKPFTALNLKDKMEKVFASYKKAS